MKKPHRILQWICGLDDDQYIVRVYSLMPQLDKYFNRYYIWWPIILVDTNGARNTQQPMWNWNRVKRLFNKN